MNVLDISAWKKRKQELAQRENELAQRQQREKELAQQQQREKELARQMKSCRRAARGLDVPRDVGSRLIHETRMELEALVARDPDGDPRPIINRAFNKLDDALYDNPKENRILKRRAERLPDHAYNILVLHTQGKTTREIARIMGTYRWLVRVSLAWSYVLLLRTGRGGGRPRTNDLRRESDKHAA